MEQSLLKKLAEELGMLKVDNLYKDLVIDELQAQVEMLSQKIVELKDKYEPAEQPEQE